MEFFKNIDLPENWNVDIEDITQTKEFAEASEGKDKIYFVCSGKNKAIIILKKKVLKIFSRAQIFTNSLDENFLNEIIEELKKRKVPYARIGNTMFGIPQEINLKNSKNIERNTFVLDLRTSLEDIWKKFDKKLRNAIRKAEKEKIKVSEIKNEAELEEYYQLSLETEKYIHQEKGRKTFSIPDYKFFKEIWKNKIGRFFVAKMDEKIIAGSLFLVWKRRSVYFQSCFSREYTEKQAPSLIHWEAIKKLKNEWITAYDLGGVTLGLNKEDSRFFIYEFKRKFGGELKKFYNIEIAISPIRKKIQDKAIKLIYKNIE
jgi:lipid II:glycine glycyltransferase (peptidoglycan interpeptide bridge formation enzyme)